MSNFVEPILLIDQNEKKEVHVLADIEDTFESVLLTARRTHQLFEGEWALHIKAQNNGFKALAKSDLVGKYTDQDITTFYWRPKIAVGYNRTQSPFETNQATQWQGMNQYNEYSQWEYTNQRSKPSFDIEEYKKNLYKGQELATVGSRLVAFMIDYAIMCALAFFMMLALFLLSGTNFNPGLFFITISAIFLGIIFYPAFLESSEQRATIGKKIMGIEVLNLYAEEGKPSFKNALARNALKFGLGGISYVFAFFSKNSQALHDLAVNTVVVKTRKNKINF